VAARVQLAAEIARGSATLERNSLAAMYLDTDDRRLARAGIAWRLRREGRRWIQTLNSAGTNELETTPSTFSHTAEPCSPSRSVHQLPRQRGLDGDRHQALIAAA
jgi:hypothetical protein